MPSLRHQAIVEIFRGKPELLLELLEHLGHRVPSGLRLQLDDSDLTASKPIERRADLVTVGRRKGKAMLALITEVQLRRRASKLRSWAAYALLAQIRFKCPAVVVVVAPDRIVARWARRLVPVAPGMLYSPLVIGPDELPPVRTLDEARRHLELAVLNALAHASSPVKIGKPIVSLALAACRKQPGAASLVYSDMIYGALGPALKEALMPAFEGYVFQSEFAKKHQAKGFAIGEAQGEARGEARGKLEGKLEATRQAIRQAMKVRKLRLTVAADKRIERETDLRTLRRWLSRAITMDKTSEVFE